MKFLSFLKPSNARSSSSSSWAWPSCHQPKTLSFRVITTTTTTTVVNSKVTNVVETFATETSESFFTETPNSASFSTATSEAAWDPIETVIRGLRSDRLFFEPDETSSIFKPSPTHSPFENSVVLSMDSLDPYADFRRSMEEMVETHGVGDWESLEELLCWYLKVNGKNNHEYIVGAFVDLLFGLAFSSSACLELHSPPSSPVSFYSSLSSCSSRCAYCLEGEDEEEGVGAASSSFSLAQAKGEIIAVDEASSSSYSNT
ncbi:transcription repressor OFP15 [Cajanus cajan]|uniref:Transcription repressor n=1 Tax=Cajanus cajan TaxID=3821 RepID=A0A151R8Q3_CAJCA|nr:transcription repressor OFP15 [Cajanus cajan]XP_020203532.1 transcription repressor OFP15 [Cajanus cajan]KYP38886.1 hypothetical protein KK1_039824 [Cajanus cajan]KYP38890.1 hypothetical protein KK1_039828 [Cajanus cajan]